MHIAKQYIVGILVLFLIAGCKSGAVSTKQKRPDWIQGESLEYPHSHYVTGSGSASKLEVAKDRALANLVKTFELKIREESKTLSDVQSTVRDGKESYTKSQRIIQDINIETDKMVEGARVAETWRNPGDKEYHALAVLERSQAGRNIRQQIVELDQSTESEMARAKAASDPLLALAAMDQAYKQQFQRQTLQQTLKVIDLKGVGSPSSWNLADMRGQLENQLLSLRMAADVASDPSGELSQLLRGAMAHAGFPATNGRADYKLVGSLQKTDIGWREGWFWVRGKVTIKLVEQSTGKVRGTHSWNFKVSAQQSEVALSRLVSKADSKIKDELKQTILQFATGVGA